jgi:hypothetical protein
MLHNFSLGQLEDNVIVFKSGSSIKPTASKFYEVETCEEDQPATCSYDVNKWLANQPDGKLSRRLIQI